MNAFVYKKKKKKKKKMFLKLSMQVKMLERKKTLSYQKKKDKAPNLLKKEPFFVCKKT